MGCRGCNAREPARLVFSGRLSLVGRRRRRQHPRPPRLGRHCLTCASRGDVRDGVSFAHGGTS